MDGCSLPRMGGDQDEGKQTVEPANSAVLFDLLSCMPAPTEDHQRPQPQKDISNQFVDKQINKAKEWRQ